MPKMPHNNRVSSSVALKTNDMWSSVIGHDPYASSADASDRAAGGGASLLEQSESLMLLAKMSKLSGTEIRGGCKKCGALGKFASLLRISNCFGIALYFMYFFLVSCF